MIDFYIGKSNGRHYECTVYEQATVQGAVRLGIRCYQTDGAGNEIKSETVRDYYRTLVADNTTLVDPATGDYVPAGTPGAIGEWDFFLHIAKTVPAIFFDLITATLEKNRARLMPDDLIPEV